MIWPENENSFDISQSILLIRRYHNFCLQNFREHRIDGAALPLLSENHLTGTMGMKLGPALKLRIMLARKIGACTVCLHCAHCHQTPLPTLSAAGAAAALTQQQPQQQQQQTPGRRPSSTGNWQTMAETPPLGSETVAVVGTPSSPSPDLNRALRIERRVPRPVRKPEVVFKKPIKQWH